MDFSDVNHRFQNGESQASVAAKTDAKRSRCWSLHNNVFGHVIEMIENDSWTAGATRAEKFLKKKKENRIRIVTWPRSICH